MGQWIRVVPGARTAEPFGVSGAMTIEAIDGQHHYEFEFELPHVQIRLMATRAPPH